MPGYENFWPQAQTNLSATGTSGGYVSVTSTLGFYVRQKVTVSGSSVTHGVVKEILNTTTLRIGSDNGVYPGTAYDMSGFNPGGVLFAPFQDIQYRSNANSLAVVYETEPVKALRVITVDYAGNYVDPSGASTPISVTVTGLSVTVSNSFVTVSNAVSNASFQYAKTVAATLTAGNASVTQAFPMATLASAARIFTVLSSNDQPVGVSLNGTQVSELNIGESFSYDLATNGRIINASTTVGLWNISATSITGSVRLQVVS